VIKEAEGYDISVNVYGGGIPAQADAVKLGIARALVTLNEQWRPMLRKAGLLTVDDRQKERKKYGQRGARRKFQFVKR
jgi:small subunit ribosomal protein S9